jgi:hypothetical protein
MSRIQLRKSLVAALSATTGIEVTDDGTEAAAIKALEATQAWSARQPVIDVQSPDTWEASIAQTQRQQRAVIRELIAVARDESQAAEERRRAIFLLGRFQEEEAMSFLIKNIELRLPLEVVKGDEDMLKSTPCWYVLMSASSWRAAQVVLSSLDVPKSDRERIYLASVLEANLGKELAKAAVDQALSTVTGRPKPQRRENLQAIKLILQPDQQTKESALRVEENAARVLIRKAKARMDGTVPPTAWPEKIRRVGTAWVVDIDTTRLPSGYAEQLVVEVTSTGGHSGKPKLKSK